MKNTILTIIVVFAVLAVGAAIIAYSGAYNISVSNHDNAFINWWLDTGMTRSVKVHSRDIIAPSLDNPAKVQEGFQRYNKNCVQCHGAPGKSQAGIAKGLWPTAPDLSKSVLGWTPEQLFWITKNGIKFTAMPAWGPTHTDEQIWAITSFLEKLPKLSPSDYQQMEKNTVAKAEIPGTQAHQR